MSELKPVQLSSRALLKYQLVSELEAHLMARKTMKQALQAVLALPHRDSAGRPVRLSARSLRRWYGVYRQHGLAGLEPKPRPRTQDSTVLEPKLLQFVRLQKQEDPSVSVPELIERARCAGVISETDKLSRTTLWRACRRMGLPLRRSARPADKDMRRFAYPNRMLMVLCDGKHFRAGVKRVRRVALHFIDDATRMGLCAVVGTSENTELFLHGLYRLIQRWGLCQALFLDHGPGFISQDTRATVARLRIRLIHGSVRFPQGHGKVERFHRTAFDKLLRGLDGNPQVDTDCGSLTLRLWHWMQNVYNHTPHRGLAPETSPAQRWHRDARELRFPDERWLKSCFLRTTQRDVGADNIVNYGGKQYEVPRGHAGHKLQLVRHLLEGDALSCLHQGKLVPLHPVNLTRNAYSARGTRPAQPESPAVTPVQTSAAMRFDQDLGPIVEPDGGYPKSCEETQP